MTPIAIPPGVLEAIYAHAIAAFPDECCGYLVGPRVDAVDAGVACRNAQADGEHPIAPERSGPEAGPLGSMTRGRGADTGFVIAGAELLGFARSFDTARPARIIYHSHTNGRAYFSALDRAMAATPAGPAYPVQHVVIGVIGRRITEAAQFAWSDEARDFVEIARWSADEAPR